MNDNKVKGFIISTRKNITWMKGDRVAISDISDYYIFPIQTNQSSVAGETLLDGGYIAGCYYTRESLSKYFAVCSGMNGLPLMLRNEAAAKTWARAFAKRDDMITSRFVKTTN